MAYADPVEDTLFILRHVVPIADLAATARFAEATDETAAAVLTEAGRIASDIVAPVNRAGDRTPARLREDGRVQSPPGFAEAFAAIASGGWVGLAAPPQHGGAGLPQLINQAVGEYLSGACLALQLNPLLTQGQIEALEQHASPQMQALYLPPLISGAWNGTMNLTEPQAGSDVGALRTQAEPAGDGSYRITGDKIFITWGDSDVTENTCHAVLARLPGAAAGTRGISLFLVPRLIPDADGRPGRANALRVVRLEDKMGIHGSPTCAMAYEGATGWLIGEAGKGMAAMFTMMNTARLAVGVQGVGVAEAALQQAAAYAAMRHQSGPIIAHPDIRRMLATARAEVFAARAICCACAAATDMAAATGSTEARARAAFLTPIAKTYGTDVGVRVADAAMQVHGGMGYIEDTGVAQYLRDVRITPIYEGTNGIQAMDLVGRKLSDEGRAAAALLDEMQEGAAAVRKALPELADAVGQAVEDMRRATQAMIAAGPQDRNAGALPYLTGFARVLGAHLHLRAAHAAPGTARETLARIHVTRILPRLAGDLAEARAGAHDLAALPDSAFQGTHGGEAASGPRA